MAPEDPAYTKGKPVLPPMFQQPVVEGGRPGRKSCNAREASGPHVWVVALRQDVQQCSKCGRLRMRPQG